MQVHTGEEGKSGKVHWWKWPGEGLLSSSATVTRSTTRLGYIVVVTSHLRGQSTELPNLIPAKFSFYMVLWLQPLHIELSCWYTVGTLNLPQQNNNYFPRWYTISEKSVNINCCRVRVPYSCQVHQLQPSSHTEGSLCMHIHLSNSWSPEMIALIHIYWLWDDCFQRNDQDIAKILCIA